MVFLSMFYFKYNLYKNKIKEIDGKNRIVYMDNGEECLISTRLIKGLL